MQFYIENETNVFIKNVVTDKCLMLKYNTVLNVIMCAFGYTPDVYLIHVRKATNTYYKVGIG